MSRTIKYKIFLVVFLNNFRTWNYADELVESNPGDNDTTNTPNVRTFQIII